MGSITRLNAAPKQEPLPKVAYIRRLTDEPRFVFTSEYVMFIDIVDQLVVGIPQFLASVYALISSSVLSVFVLLKRSQIRGCTLPSRDSLLASSLASWYPSISWWPRVLKNLSACCNQLWIYYPWFQSLECRLTIKLDCDWSYWRRNLSTNIYGLR